MLRSVGDILYRAHIFILTDIVRADEFALDAILLLSEVKSQTCCIWQETECYLWCRFTLSQVYLKSHIVQGEGVPFTVSIQQYSPRYKRKKNATQTRSQVTPSLAMPANMAS
jgi:hypothetical protein